MSDTWEERVKRISTEVGRMKADPDQAAWAWFLGNTEQWLATQLRYPPTGTDVKALQARAEKAESALRQIRDVLEDEGVER